MGDLLTARVNGAAATAAAPPSGPGERLGARVVLRDLSHRYEEGALAVDRVALDIAAGEFMTLLGPSGSGKTTTLKMIAGFEAPDEGEILVGERPVTDVPPHDRNIGMVFQNYALFPHMTVRDNVGFPLKMRGWKPERVRAAIAETLALVRLEDFVDRYPRQLSGGQQQRVALARAIVFRPPVLLMDEPLGALDRQLRAQVQVEIKRIQEDLGLTVIYVTHDQEEALFLSDRIALMNNGRIEQLGAPQELYEEPASRFVAEFLGESNLIPGRVVAHERGVAEVDLGGARVRGRATEPLRPGQEATVAVRPEKFRLDEASTSTNRLAGTVVERRFSGEAIRLGVRADWGAQVAVKALARAGQATPAVGDRCQLTWSEDDTRVFPA